jgi:hypothetical protein
MWAGVAALHYSIYICFVAAILPTSLMIIFSLLAYKNLQYMKRNIHPQQTVHQEEGKIKHEKKCDFNNVIVN